MTRARVLAALSIVRRREVLALLAGLAILVALGSLADRRKAALRPPPPASYASGDYNPGGFRAFAELLRRRGAAVMAFDRHLTLLGNDGEDPRTLVYAEPVPGDPAAAAPTRGDVAALEAWVRGGGRLLYLGSDDAAARSHLLGLPKTVAAAERRPFAAPVLAAAGVAAVDAPRGRRYALVRGMTLLFADRAGALALTYRFGRGRVTAEIDPALFTNGAIATADRARFAVALAGAPGRSGAVAFDDAIHGSLAAESWWQAFPAPLDAGLALAAVALVLLGVAEALRLGPPLIPGARDDRDSGEFARALAGLYARAGAAPTALGEALAAIAGRLRRSRGLGPVDADGPGASLAERLPASDAEDYRALEGLARRPTLDDAAFVRGVALAHRLWKDARDGRP